MSKTEKWLRRVSEMSLRLRELCVPPENIDDFAPLLRRVRRQAMELAEMASDTETARAVIRLAADEDRLNTWEQTSAYRACAVGVGRLHLWLIHEAVAPMWEAVMLNQPDRRDTWSGFLKRIEKEHGAAGVMRVTLAMLWHLPPLGNPSLVMPEAARAFNPALWMLSLLPHEWFFEGKPVPAGSARLLDMVRRIRTRIGEEPIPETRVPALLPSPVLASSMDHAWTVQWCCAKTGLQAVARARDSGWQREALQELVRFMREA